MKALLYSGRRPREPLLDEIRTEPAAIGRELERALVAHASGDLSEFTPEHAWALLGLLRDQWEGKKPEALRSRRAIGKRNDGRSLQDLKLDAVDYVLRASDRAAARQDIAAWYQVSGKTVANWIKALADDMSTGTRARFSEARREQLTRQSGARYRHLTDRK